MTKDKDYDSDSEFIKKLERIKKIDKYVSAFCTELLIYIVALTILYLIFSSISNTIEINRELEKLHKRNRY
jgi:hypothetical protein